MTKKKIFANKTSYLVLAFIVSCALMLAFCEDAAADFSIEEQHDSTAGTSSFNHGLDRVCIRKTYATQTSMYFCPLVAVGGDIKGDSFEIGIADTILPRVEAELRVNRFDGEMDGGFSMRRMIGDGKFKLGLGGTYWMNESPGSNSNFTFNLVLRYTF